VSEVSHAQPGDSDSTDGLGLMSRGSAERTGGIVVGGNVKGVVGFGRVESRRGDGSGLSPLGAEGDDGSKAISLPERRAFFPRRILLTD
jgi:hypothetical protein